MLRFENIPINNILNESVKRLGIIVDVRTREEFLLGHIPMAISLPLSNIEQGKINLPKGRWLFVYCTYGGGSAKAAKLLSNMGYKVVNTIGGMVSYRGSLTKER